MTRSVFTEGGPGPAGAATVARRARRGGQPRRCEGRGGEGSFLADTRLALAAVDAAVLVVSGKDGVQPITERVFQWTRAQGLPTLVVVTKVDAENVMPDEVVAELRQRLKAPVAVMELHV